MTCIHFVKNKEYKTAAPNKLPLNSFKKKYPNLFGGIEPFAYLCSVKKMTTWIVEIRRSLCKADSAVSIISR